MNQRKAGMIRWWGLGLFVGLVGAMALLWLLVVDGLVKSVIEEEGTAIVGAKVELDTANLTLFPAGVTLTRLQLTNPNSPMTNFVEIARVTMDLDGLQLLRRKVIINEMLVEGVQFGTVRGTSGEIDDRTREPGPSEPEEDLRFTLPPFEVPNVQQILEQEDLETLKLIRALQTDIEREQEVWKKRLTELPGKAEFVKYQKRIEALKNFPQGGIGGVLGGVDALNSLKQEIEHDLVALKSARKEFNEKVAVLNQRIAQVQSAPQRDVHRLKEKYSLSPQGLANLGQALLGKHIGSKLKEAAGYYEMLRPYLESMETVGISAGKEAGPMRGEGEDIHFAEYKPLPEFLIRLAKVSLRLEIGEVSGKLENITPDQDTLGMPLTYTFAGEQLKDLQQVTIEGVLDHRDAAYPKDTMQFHAKGVRIHSVALSTQPDWPVTLADGLADVVANAELRGQAMNATAMAELSSLKVLAGKPEDTNPLTMTLSQAISDISTLSIQVDVTGTLEHFDIRIRSELDRLLKDAAGKMVATLAASFGKDLQSAISARVAEPLTLLTGSFRGLDAIGGDLTRRLAKEHTLLQGLLKEGLPKKALPKGLKDKIPGGFTLPF